jgi:hypothetical protein
MRLLQRDMARQVDEAERLLRKSLGMKAVNRPPRPQLLAQIVSLGEKCNDRIGGRLRYLPSGDGSDNRAHGLVCQSIE